MKKNKVFLLIFILGICSIFLISTPEEEKITENKPVTENEQVIEQNKHSQFYIPGIDVEEVITYFKEVALDAEFINAGDPTKIQKWNEPIYYIVNGTRTLEDNETLNRFTSWLNKVEGFPGIYEVSDAKKANLRIHFCSHDQMVDIMGKKFKNLDGAVTYWYADDIIYDAVICYRIDIEQDVRNSVIIEEIYNGLGLIQDTELRKDSIIYSGFSKPQELTKIDELLLKLLYSKEIENGMNYKECEEVIRKLYY